MVGYMFSATEQGDLDSDKDFPNPPLSKQVTQEEAKILRTTVLLFKRKVLNPLTVPYLQQSVLPRISVWGFLLSLIHTYFHTKWWLSIVQVVGGGLLVSQAVALLLGNA